MGYRTCKVCGNETTDEEFETILDYMSALFHGTYGKWEAVMGVEAIRRSQDGADRICAMCLVKILTQLELELGQ